MTSAGDDSLSEGPEREGFWDIADFVPAMIWHKDTENRIIRLNRAAANLMGLPVTAIEGKSVFDLDPEFADQYYADDKEVIRTGEPKTGIIEPIITATDEKRWLRTDKVPYRNREGAIVGVIVFSVDITEFKRGEEHQGPGEEPG